MATNRKAFQETLSLQELFGEDFPPDPKNKLSPIRELIEPSTEAAGKEQEDTSKPKPMVLLDRGDNSRDRFRIMHPIGTASGGSLQVYKAAYIAEHSVTYASMAVQDVFVAVKYESMDPEPDVFRNLKAQVEKNGLIPDHENLMGIRSVFFYDGYMCVVFPLMDLGSMRSIMATQFPDGMPEECILVALREALKGLSFIHAKGHVHKEITAGHIFFNGKPEIKLAFSASVFDLNEEQNESSSSSSFLPAVSIYDWATAPEVHESNHSEYPQAADIWLIGITALELAYGGVRVMNREALVAMVTKINLKKKLRKKVKKGRGVDLIKTDKIVCLDPSWIDPKVQFKKRKFSKGFQNLVVKCLNLDSTKRPTADELLQYEIFTNLNMSVSLFKDLLMNNI